MIKSKKIKILLVIVFIALVVVLYLLLIDRQNKQKAADYIPVNNASTFFTVSSCAERYISYLSNRQTDDLEAVLNRKYNVEDVINEFSNVDGSSYRFKAKKIYQATMSKNNVKYYVYGLLRKEMMDEYDYGTPYYLIVDINTKDYTFSVTPYNGKVFK